jgi:hypothetical protein
MIDREIITQCYGLLDKAKSDLIYLMVELKGEREQLNDEGLLALYQLRTFYNRSVEQVDEDIKEIFNFLEKYEKEFDLV